ncbi:MAG TPA: 4Fe-4S binding protein [Clostridiaceae bacterium]|nr:4Fe-4S binding protein [Clostridiaceae bacterium]
MIFYFSGTGNSLYVAKKISEIQGERLISVAGEMERKDTVFEYEFSEKELLGFVFPVYAWGPPRIVIDFISKLRVSGGKPYVFSVCTCGDDEGYATRMLQKAFAKAGLSLDSAFTVIMPNTYIIGFDVDSKDVASEKLRRAEEKLQTINTVISDRERGVFDLIPGRLSGLKSAIVNPLFNRFGRSTKRFYATGECTGCGTCATVCPLHTITIKGKPVWGKSCTQCLACIHRCPVRAIQYGKATVRKGRYVHPDII